MEKKVKQDLRIIVHYKLLLYFSVYGTAGFEMLNLWPFHVQVLEDGKNSTQITNVTL